MNFTQHFAQMHRSIASFLAENKAELASVAGQETRKAAEAMLKVAEIGQGLEASWQPMSIGISMQAAAQAAGLTNKKPYTFSAVGELASVNAKFAGILLGSITRVASGEATPDSRLLSPFLTKIQQVAQKQQNHLQGQISAYQATLPKQDSKSLPSSSYALMSKAVSSTGKADAAPIRVMLDEKEAKPLSSAIDALKTVLADFKDLAIKRKRWEVRKLGLYQEMSLMNSEKRALQVKQAQTGIRQFGMFGFVMGLFESILERVSSYKSAATLASFSEQGLSDDLEREEETCKRQLKGVIDEAKAQEKTVQVKLAEALAPIRSMKGLNLPAEGQVNDAKAVEKLLVVVQSAVYTEQVVAKVSGWQALDSDSQDAVRQCVGKSLQGQDLHVSSVDQVTTSIAKKVELALYDKWGGGKGVYLQGHGVFARAFGAFSAGETLTEDALTKVVKESNKVPDLESEVPSSPAPASAMAA